MKLRVWQAAFVATAFIATGVAAHAAQTEDKSVAEKILDILKEQGQISEARRLDFLQFLRTHYRQQDLDGVLFWVLRPESVRRDP